MDEWIYRYEDQTFASCSLSEFGVEEWYSSGPKLVLRKFKVLKRTPKGAWIEESLQKRFVLLTARKRFACNTEEEALDSYIARKEAHLRHINNRKTYVERVLKKAKVLRAGFANGSQD